jgi:tetratricopeptide (TPR) repeat protein
VLQGNYLFDKLDKENVIKSIEFYLKAVKLDSTYAKAWAALARSYSRLSWNNWIDQISGYEKARATSLKAIFLNENSVDGLRALGAVKFYHDFDWQGAEELFKKALSLEPTNAEVLSVYAVWHQTQGSFQKSLALSKEAISYDPLKPLFYTIYANTYSFAGEHEKGITEYHKALELNPVFNSAYFGIGRNYLLMGKHEKAFAAFNKETLELNRESGWIMYLHAIGRKKAADSLLNKFITKFHEWPYRIASIFSYIGDKENAVKWLQHAYEKQDSWLIYIKGDPLLKNIRSEAAYLNILQKMNLK